MFISVWFIGVMGVCPGPGLPMSLLAEGKDLLTAAEIKGVPDSNRQLQVELTRDELRPDLPTLRFSMVHNHPHGVALIFEQPLLIRGVIISTNTKDELYFRLPGQSHIQTIHARSRLHDFMGSQFNLNDLNGIQFSRDYEVCNVQRSDGLHRLTLKRISADRDKGNPFLLVQIARISGLINQVDYLDRNGKVERRQVRRSLVRHEAANSYYSEIVMYDLKSGDNSIVRVTSTESRSPATYGPFDKRWIARVARFAD